MGAALDLTVVDQCIMAITKRLATLKDEREGFVSVSDILEADREIDRYERWRSIHQRLRDLLAEDL
ncbi:MULTISPECIES: hypothetical protein [unclassified Rhizobium]|jgi:hypothetical protein